MPAIEDAMARRVLDSQTGTYSYPWTQNLPDDYLSKIATIHNNNDMIINTEVQNVFAGMVQPAVDVTLETLKSALDFRSMKEGSPYVERPKKLVEKPEPDVPVLWDKLNDDSALQTRDISNDYVIPKLSPYEDASALESTLSNRVNARLQGVPQFGYPIGPDYLSAVAAHNSMMANLELMRMNKEIVDTSIQGAAGEILGFAKDAQATSELRKSQPDVVDEYTASVKTNVVPQSPPDEATVLFVNGEPRYF